MSKVRSSGGSLLLTTALLLVLGAPASALDDAQAPPQKSTPQEQVPEERTMPREHPQEGGMMSPEQAPAEGMMPQKQVPEEGTMPAEQAPAEGMMPGKQIPGQRTIPRPRRKIGAAQEAAPRRPAPMEQAQPPQAAGAEKISEQALQALADLSKRLQDLHSYTIAAELNWDEVLKSGEKIAASEDMWADVAPGELKMTIISPGRERVLYYDGKKVALWSPISGYYTTEDYEGNLADLTIYLAERHAFEIPLSDLFLWSRQPVDIRDITEAHFVGRDRVGGKLCDHYAYRQKGVDWQIWIDTEGDGLPCRYRIVDTADPTRPAWEATLSIDESGPFVDRRFSFVPPADAVEIPFQSTGKTQ